MRITKNHVVTIDYTLRDSEHQILESSEGSEPLAYLHGYQSIIPGLEQALEDKSAGDAFTVTIPAAEAYGERDEQLVITVPLDSFEDAGAVKEGMQFEADTPDGYRLLTVTQVGNKTATVDINHPMAGMDLTFDITVKTVREADPGEISHGHIHHAHHHHETGNCG
jgi:FKBP-type peptidyl-prolyl cis-trans isomerase SlyD